MPGYVAMKKNNRKREELLILMLFFSGVAAYGKDLPMTVEIKVAQATVKNNEDFPVSTTIRNVDKDDQSLRIWSCSYPQQWTADNPAVHITNASCKKNDVILIRLKPGETYERMLSIQIVVAADLRAQKSLVFRLRFEPVTSQKTGDFSPVWSNSVTVSVTE